MTNALLEQRRLKKAEAAAKGEHLEFNDAVEWLEQTAQEKNFRYDAGTAQLSLSLLALHSSVDFFTQAILDIASNPELIEPLRAEIISVLGTDGWSKQSVFKLKLLDSVLKESQRLKPVALGASTSRSLPWKLTYPDNSNHAPHDYIRCEIIRWLDVAQG